MSNTMSRSRPGETIAEIAHSAVEAQAAAARRASDQFSAAGAGFEQGQSRIKENMDRAMKTAEEMLSFGQGNLEAVMKSSQIWAAGMQDLSKRMAAMAQAQMDETMSAFKAMSGVRTLKDAVDVQTGLTRTTVEKLLSEGGRLTEASMKLSEQAIAPVAARVSLAVEKFGRAA